MTTQERIQLKQKELQLIDEPDRRSKIQKEIKKLKLRQEIEVIKRKIEQLS